MNSATLVQKLWNYCNILRDDVLSYDDYVEQLTFLLFLMGREEMKCFAATLRQQQAEAAKLDAAIAANLKGLGYGR